MLLCVIIHSTTLAQRFSFVPEIGGLTSQLDGDALNGFSKYGYTLGIGARYIFDRENLLNVKASLYNQGSKRDVSVSRIAAVGSSQLELNLSTIGVEVSYLRKHPEKPLFFGLGIVYHKVLGFSGKSRDIISASKTVRDNLETLELGSGYVAMKAYVGIDIDTRYSLSFGLESGVSEISGSKELVDYTLLPYSIHLSLAYEINPQTVKEKNKKRSRDRN